MGQTSGVKYQTAKQCDKAHPGPDSGSSMAPASVMESHSCLMFWSISSSAIVFVVFSICSWRRQHWPRELATVVSSIRPLHRGKGNSKPANCSMSWHSAAKPEARLQEQTDEPEQGQESRRDSPASC